LAVKGEQKMTKHEQLGRVLAGGLVAIIRAPTSDSLVSVAEALVRGGVETVEVTFTVPNALRVLEQVADKLGDRVLIGAGTVLDAETTRAAMLAGAEFIVSPIVNYGVIQLCQRYDKLVMPGALTPTEVVTAWEAGADVVKIFPADVGGPAYLKALRAPLPQIRMMPTGGVDLRTATAFLDAGACALGMGGSLVSADDIRRGDFEAITKKATAFVKLVNDYRASKRT
jgi:2-dehydro-3-deoxyphosphogluconate aldolase/(4S)-4-hydroxy-2-oxoglutarate aldolase